VDILRHSAPIPPDVFFWIGIFLEQLNVWHPESLRERHPQDPIGERASGFIMLTVIFDGHRVNDLLLNCYSL
jgi:hypothetical protein